MRRRVPTIGLRAIDRLRPCWGSVVVHSPSWFGCQNSRMMRLFSSLKELNDKGEHDQVIKAYEKRPHPEEGEENTRDRTEYIRALLQRTQRDQAQLMQNINLQDLSSNKSKGSSSPSGATVGLASFSLLTPLTRFFGLGNTTQDQLEEKKTRCRRISATTAGGYQGSRWISSGFSCLPTTPYGPISAR